MARPRKEEHERRSERSEQRYTLAEMEHIREQAARAGLEPSVYIRMRAVGHQIHPAPSRGSADPALVSELNRIGVNVNQLAKATHRGSDFTRYWMHIAGELRSALAKVMARDGS